MISELRRQIILDKLNLNLSNLRGDIFYGDINLLFNYRKLPEGYMTPREFFNCFVNLKLKLWLVAFIATG